MRKESKIITLHLPIDLSNQLDSFNEQNLTSKTKVLIKALQEFLASRATK